jgi:hypothetical protein
MVGSIIAGGEEAPGDTIIFESRKYKTYRGMGSIDAMQQGSKDRYFQDHEDDLKKLVPEGIVGRVAYKGLLTEVIHQMSGGLKAVFIFVCLFKISISSVFFIFLSCFKFSVLQFSFKAVFIFVCLFKISISSVVGSRSKVDSLWFNSVCKSSNHSSVGFQFSFNIQKSR